MDNPPVDNLTDYEVHPQLMVDKDGEKLVAIVKATFELQPDGRGGGVLEVPPEPRHRLIRQADVPWGKPEISSIMFPSDLCLRKPGTDVIVVARAHAPNSEPVPSFDVAVQVGSLHKALKIFGLRVWEAGGAGVTPPRPIAEIEMRYDWAWGGCDTSDPLKVVEDARNPVGRGVVRDNSILTHKPAPNIEDPSQLISSVRTKPPPAGVGPIGRHWMPRRQFVGTYDQNWLDTRAPLVPLDHDDRHNLCATPDLCTGYPLHCTEEVKLLNLVRGGGAVHFALPNVGVEIEFKHKERPPERVTPHLDTVLIDCFDEQPGEPIAVELVWRAHVKAPRRVKDCTVMVTDQERQKS
jgi:hypothetical protein